METVSLGRHSVRPPSSGRRGTVSTYPFKCTEGALRGLVPVPVPAQSSQVTMSPERSLSTLVAGLSTPFILAGALCAGGPLAVMPATLLCFLAVAWTDLP